ncbi:MAG: flagellar hook-basal body complex protein FliE [Pseudomonadota bacterium]
MDTSNSIIAQLYARASTAVQPEAAPPAGGPDFATLAGQTVNGIAETEALATQALSGAADPQSVVMALAETELAIEAAVTVRDKIVEAYQEILRMPV